MNIFTMNLENSKRKFFSDFFFVCFFFQNWNRNLNYSQFHFTNSKTLVKWIFNLFQRLKLISIFRSFYVCAHHYVYDAVKRQFSQNKNFCLVKISLIYLIIASYISNFICGRTDCSTCSECVCIKWQRCQTNYELYQVQSKWNLTRQFQVNL